VTLKDAGNYITKLPKAEHEAPEWAGGDAGLDTGRHVGRADDACADRDNAGVAPREARTGASATTQAGQEIQGSPIRDESVPRNSAVYFGNGPGEPNVGCGMEDVAMLVFYLPIIIFEAMLEANANKCKVGEPTVSFRPVIASENELRDTVSRRHFQNP
jgi:hypothetical protein